MPPALLVLQNLLSICSAYTFNVTAYAHKHQATNPAQRRCAHYHVHETYPLPPSVTEYIDELEYVHGMNFHRTKRRSRCTVRCRVKFGVRDAGKCRRVKCGEIYTHEHTLNECRRTHCVAQESISCREVVTVINRESPSWRTIQRC